MAIKIVKSSLMVLGIFSAISLSPLLFNGGRANAQTRYPEINPGMMNEAPTDINPSNNKRPMELNRNSTPYAQNPLDPTGRNEGPTAPIESTTPTTSSPITGYISKTAPLLSYGSRGATVIEVQSVLTQQGLYNGPIDGLYGPETQAAVKVFQESVNITPDGVMGRGTWDAMIKRLQQG